MPRLQFMLFAVLLAALSGSALAQGKNEQLFENCRAHEKYKANRAEADALTITRSIACISYIGGAWQMYNLVTEAACGSANRTGEEVVADYLAFTRKGGFLDQPQQMVVYKLIEACYCGKDPATQYFCPSKAGQSPTPPEPRK